MAQEMAQEMEQGPKTEKICETCKMRSLLHFEGDLSRQPHFTECTEWDSFKEHMIDILQYKYRIVENADGWYVYVRLSDFESSAEEE